jgi:hypothetical protein
MAISSVTSEALQLKLRQLLPSQQGFGTDLTATDTIVPIIDLTQAAEGSDVSESLQTALAFASNTAFRAEGNTQTLANTPGFYRIVAGVSIENADSAERSVLFQLGDGSSTKTILGFATSADSTALQISENVDFVAFLRAGDTLTCVSSQATALALGSTRQIADNNGTLVQPSGFTPQ